MFYTTIARGWLALTIVASAVTVQADVFNMPSGQASLQFATVGDPGNAADATSFGSVPYVYSMGKYDVTAAQYCQFLNAVAMPGDSFGLFNVNMANPPSLGPSSVGCGISRTVSSGTYSYTVSPSDANFPVTFVSWGDAARFCNWLQNGQPIAPEGDGTTETGAYNVDGMGTAQGFMQIARNPGARYFIPSENEWYKAAYYDSTLNGGAGGYWSYSTRSNSTPSNTLSSTGTNSANYSNGSYTDPINYLTPVGYFAGSPGPYGTYDMEGDVWDWNEAIMANGRGFRGGSFYYYPFALPSTYRNYVGFDPTIEYSDIGFRVASVPEPGSIGLLLAGAIGLLAFAWRSGSHATRG